MTCHVCAKATCLGECIPEISQEPEENKALRMFLAYYGGNEGVTIQGMRSHLKYAGFNGYWPEWVNTEEGHLTKSGAQLWIRYILAAEDSTCSISPFSSRCCERGTKSCTIEHIMDIPKDMTLVPKEVADAAILWAYCPKEGSYYEGPSVEDTCESLSSSVETWLGVHAPDEWISVEDMETLVGRKIYGK